MRSERNATGAGFQPLGIALHEGPPVWNPVETELEVSW